MIATCRSESDKEIASRAGAGEVLLTGQGLVKQIPQASDGVQHIVEVAFGANIKTDTEVLAQGGSIATYATNTPMPEIPLWQLVFVNARLFFVGSDDVPAEAKIAPPLTPSIRRLRRDGRDSTSPKLSRWIRSHAPTNWSSIPRNRARDCFDCLDSTRRITGVNWSKDVARTGIMNSARIASKASCKPCPPFRIER